MTGKNLRTDMICFRATPDLRDRIQQVATKEKRSLSNVIEIMLGEALKTRSTDPARERRKDARRKCDFPALIRKSELPEAHAGMILDLSLTGMKVSLPSKAFPENEQKAPAFGHILVTFSVPEDNSTVTVECAPEWTSRKNGTMNLGVSFADCAFNDYRRIQKYLT